MRNRQQMRDADEMIRHPDYHFNVGRLVGASEMAAHWLRTQDDPQGKEMAERLLGISAWFFNEQRPAHDTLVRRPKGGEPSA